MIWRNVDIYPKMINPTFLILIYVGYNSKATFVRRSSNDDDDDDDDDIHVYITGEFPH